MSFFAMQFDAQTCRRFTVAIICTCVSSILVASRSVSSGVPIKPYIYVLCWAVLGPCWTTLAFVAPMLDLHQACVEACWAMRGLCRGHGEFVGPIISHVGPCWAYVGPMLGHVDLGHSINVAKHWILVLEQNKHTPKLKLNNA